MYRARLVVVLGVLSAAASAAPAADPYFQQSVIFSSGDGYPVYRIPSIVTSNAGTLLAFAEGRPSTADLGENDIVLKRSLDNGATWQTMQVVAPASAAGVPTRGFNSPTPVVDRTTGDIFLFTTIPALAGPTNNYEILVSKSSDDGATWTAPTNISASVRPSGDRYMSAGPGSAIQLQNGRIIVPFYSRNLNDGNLSGETHFFYSDNHGTSWQLGGEVPKPANYPGQSQPISIIEPSMVETDNGLYVNMRTRNYGPTSNRSYSFSTDGGLTWTTSAQDPTLIDSNTQGAVERWTTLADDGVNRILLSNTYSAAARENLSVQTSYDEALSWTNQRSLFFGLSAYSDMSVSNNGLMNVLYENGRATDPRYASLSLYQQITLAQFNTEWLETPVTYNVRYDFAEQASGTAPTTDAYVRDSGGWNLHTTVTTTGNAVYVQGAPGGDGRAIRLSGDGAGVIVSNPDSRQFYNFTANDSFTVEAILRTNMTGDGMIMGRGAFVTDSTSGFFPHWYFRVSDGYLNLHLRDDNGVIATLTSNVTITDGDWHSVAAIRDVNADLLSLVVDGEVVGLMIDPTSSFDALLSNSSVWIGFNGNHSEYLSADLDAVRFSRGALTTNQLMAVPEPGSVALTLTAVGGLMWRGLRRRRKASPPDPVETAS